MTDLEHRVQRLEHENRRLKQVGLLVLLAIGAVVLSGQASDSIPKEIKAERFVAVGREGSSVTLNTDGLIARTAMGADLGLTVATGGFDVRTSSRDSTLHLGSDDIKLRIPGVDYQMTLDASGIVLESHGAGATRLRAGALTLESGAQQGARVSVTDGAGLARAVLGATTTLTKGTGMERRRPESSLVLLDEENTVVYEAP